MVKSRVRTLLLFTILLSSAYQPAAAQTDLRVGGYLQTWYVADQKTVTGADETSRTNGFRMNRARLVAKGNISEKFSTTTWFEFASGTDILLDFHIDLHLKSWLNVRIGQFIMPGQSHDTGKLVSSKLIFWDRPNVTTALARGMGYTAFRDIGLMIYGSHGKLRYGIHAGNGFDRFSQPGIQISEREFGSGLYGARIDYRITEAVSVGGHLSTNQQRNVVQQSGDPFDINRSSYSLRFAAKDFLIDGLYTQLEWMGLNAGDDSRGIRLNEDGQYNLHGIYIDIGYMLNRNWHLTSRYDQIIEKPGQFTGIGSARRFKKDGYTFGLSHYLFQDNSEFARFHLNYSFEKSEPILSEQSILVLVAQFRFIPM